MIRLVEQRESRSLKPVSLCQLENRPLSPHTWGQSPMPGCVTGWSVSLVSRPFLPLSWMPCAMHSLLIFLGLGFLCGWVEVTQYPTGLSGWL